MRQYTQLTQQQRYQISALMKAGHNQVETANIVGVHKSTISRELKRNHGLRGYRPQQAERLAIARRLEKARPQITLDHWQQVESLLREDWSPEQISLWLAQEKRLWVSHEWIYQYVLRDKWQGGDLYRHLRCQKQRKKRYGTYSRRGQLCNRVSLDAAFYFAHPYASWERGLSENTNGLVRQYFLKHRDFTTITEQEVQNAMNKLNNRPRKCLGMKTPNQVFFGINPPVALAS